MSLHGNESFSIISGFCIVVSDLLSDTHQLVHLLKLVSLWEESSAEIQEGKMAHVRREAEKRVKIHWRLPAKVHTVEKAMKRCLHISSHAGPWNLDREASELICLYLSISSRLSLVTWSVVLCYDSPSKPLGPYSQVLSLLTSSYSASSQVGTGSSHTLSLE